MLKPEFSGQFKRDYKLAIKRGCDPKKLEEVITLLCNEQPLPEAYRDHALTNSRNYKDMRECHIEPDWLLVYKVVRQTLILKLIRTGSQSVFGNFSFYSYKKACGQKKTVRGSKNSRRLSNGTPAI